MSERTISVGGTMIPLCDWRDEASEVILPDLSEWERSDGAPECWSNDLDQVYRWPLEGGSYLYVYYCQGAVNTATIQQHDIDAYLRTCDHDEIDDAEWLASWGLDGLQALTPVNKGDDYAGPCRVWHQPHYYRSTCGAPRAGYAGDEAGKILEFDTPENAYAYVECYYSKPSQYEGIPACNVLSHGQYAADTLTVVRAD